MPSDRYEHKSDDLWQQYHDKKMDHAKYMELLEQLKNNELRQYNADSQGGVESGIWRYEKRRKKARQLEAEQEAEAERVKKLPPWRSIRKPYKQQ